MRNSLLDEDRPGTVRLSEAQARAVALKALAKCGYDEVGATIITDQLVDNALCGYPFASLARILTIAEETRNREARAEPHIVRETPSSALVDGGNTIGYIAAFRGAEIAARKAKETGLSIVGVYNSFYSGRNAWYVENIVRHDLVAIHTCSASPRVLPPGSRAPLLGTNPISIGFPSTNGPIVWDIGTASVMWGDVQLMARLGHEVPEGTGFDKDGNPTRDAAKVLQGGVNAWGGHKGYGLSFCIQALGLIAGAALGRGVVNDYGFLFIAIDPGLTQPDNAFQHQMTELIETIKALPKQDGVDEIRIPSERAFAERAVRRVEGIVVEKKIVEMLEAL
ncbi:MAG: Ldh family oxidoreductase [Acetobacteraceae bacterium]|nr:Ldh family oxidoreductase [Acetobacteraceae bacterium]